MQVSHSFYTVSLAKWSGEEAICIITSVKMTLLALHTCTLDSGN